MMHERIEGSRLEILPHLRHSVLVEAPERIAELLIGHFGDGKHAVPAFAHRR